MFKSFILTAAAFTFAPALSFAAPSVSAQNGVATPSRVDVGVGVGHDKGRPERPGRPGRPGRHSVSCYARNARGMTFRADSFSASSARNQAMRQCMSHSRRCQFIGCR
jgi:hypothetical protein